MKLKIFILFVITVLSLNINAQTPVTPFQSAVLQQKLDSCVTAFNVPGVSAALLLPGDKYWVGASGVSDIYSFDPIDTTHIFYQASVTKMFVAAIIFQMVEQNLLSIDDSIGKYLPPILTVPSSTKIRFLLNHRSGLFNFIGGNPAATNSWFSIPDSIWTPQLAIETYNSNPAFSQGSSFAYSNTNYIVLGMLIERITGNAFATELKNRILIPYGLHQTFFPPFDSIAGNQVTGWTSFTSLSGPYNTDASLILNDCSTSMFFTAGALVSSPRDVAKFTRLLFSGRFVHDTTLILMKTCTNVNLGNNCNGYGYGTMRYNFAGKTYFGHAGDLSGFTNLTIHNETDDITLAISINRNNAPRGPVALAILNALQQVLTVGVNEPEINNLSFNIYPNPANSTTRIDFVNSDNETYHVELINQQGQRVHSAYLGNHSNHHTIDLENFSGGIYLIKLSNGIRNEIKKLIIHH